ncbi:NAD-dependent epimerase/dehydratase family protein [Bacteroidota bacterium]
MEINKTKPILVTGASGYIASWIIKKLLEKGFTVRGTVRSLSNKNLYEHLLKMAEELPGNFIPFEADLLNEESFDEAVKGCEIVIHTASPFYVTRIKDPQKELIAPAFQGTRNVLNSVNKSQSVKKVVHTSSAAAMHGDNADVLLTKNGFFDESHWNETSSAHYQPYPFSKTIAEKEAWKMAAAQNSWQLVVINPSFVLGPSLTNRIDSTSISTILDFLKGKMAMGLPELYMGVVDVRNVADAHIEAAFRDDTVGRHLLSSEQLSILAMAATIEENFPGKYKLPRNTIPKFLAYMFGIFFGYSWTFVKKNVGFKFGLDNRKSIEKLGLQYIPFKQTIKDQVDQLVEDGMVK